MDQFNLLIQIQKRSQTLDLIPIALCRQRYYYFRLQCSVLYIFVCPCVLFLLTIVLSVRVRFMTYLLPFSIIKPVLKNTLLEILMLKRKTRSVHCTLYILHQMYYFAFLICLNTTRFVDSHFQTCSKPNDQKTK